MVVGIPKKSTYSVINEADRTKTLNYLELEKQCDKDNYQEMLNVVDLTSLTKAKITALGKLGKQYEKASTGLIKKYKQAPVRFTTKEKLWIRPTQ